MRVNILASNLNHRAEYIQSTSKPHSQLTKYSSLDAIIMIYRISSTAEKKRVKIGSTNSMVPEVEQVSQMDMEDPAALGKRAIVGARIRPSNNVVGEEKKELRHPTNGHESPDVQEGVCEM